MDRIAHLRSLFNRLSKPLTTYYLATHKISCETGKPTKETKNPSNRGIGALRESAERLEAALVVLGSKASDRSRSTAEDTVRDVFTRTSEAATRWCVLDVAEVRALTTDVKTTLGALSGASVVAKDEVRETRAVAKPAAFALPAGPLASPELPMGTFALPVVDAKLPAVRRSDATLAPPVMTGPHASIDEHVRRMVDERIALVVEPVRADLAAVRAEVSGLQKFMTWVKEKLGAKRPEPAVVTPEPVAPQAPTAEEVSVTPADDKAATAAAVTDAARPVDRMIACAVQALKDAGQERSFISLHRVKGSTRKLVIRHEPSDTRRVFIATDEAVETECAAIRKMILRLATKHGAGEKNVPVKLASLPADASLRALAAAEGLDLTETTCGTLFAALGLTYALTDKDRARLGAEHARLLRWHSDRGHKVSPAVLAEHAITKTPAKGSKPPVQDAKPVESPKVPKRETPRELATLTATESTWAEWAERSPIAEVKAKKSKLDESIARGGLGFESIEQGERDVGATSNDQTMADYVVKAAGKGPDSVFHQRVMISGGAGTTPLFVYGLKRNEGAVRAAAGLIGYLKGYGRSDLEKAGVAQALGYSDDAIREFLLRDRIAAILVKRERETAASAENETAAFAVGDAVELTAEGNKRGEITALVQRQIGNKGPRVLLYTVKRADGKVRTDVRQGQLQKASAEPAPAVVEPVAPTAKPAPVGTGPVPLFDIGMKPESKPRTLTLVSDAKVGNAKIRRLTIEPTERAGHVRTVVKLKLDGKPDEATENKLRGHYGMILAREGADAPYWYGYPYPIDDDALTYKRSVVELVHDLAGGTALPVPVGYDGGPKRAGLTIAVATDGTFSAALVRARAEEAADAAPVETPKPVVETPKPVVETAKPAPAPVVEAPKPSGKASASAVAQSIAERIRAAKGGKTAPVASSGGLLAELQAWRGGGSTPVGDYYADGQGRISLHEPSARLKALLKESGFVYNRSGSTGNRDGSVYDAPVNSTEADAIVRALGGISPSAESIQKQKADEARRVAEFESKRTAHAIAPPVAVSGDVVALAPPREPSLFAIGQRVEVLGEGLKTVKTVAWDEFKGQYVYSFVEGRVAMESEVTESEVTGGVPMLVQEDVSTFNVGDRVVYTPSNPNASFTLRGPITHIPRRGIGRMSVVINPTERLSDGRWVPMETPRQDAHTEQGIITRVPVSAPALPAPVPAAASTWDTVSVGDAVEIRRQGKPDVRGIVGVIYNSLDRGAAVTAVDLTGAQVFMEGNGTWKDAPDTDSVGHRVGRKGASLKVVADYRGKGNIAYSVAEIIAPVAPKPAGLPPGAIPLTAFTSKASVESMEALVSLYDDTGDLYAGADGIERLDIGRRLITKAFPTYAKASTGDAVTEAEVATASEYLRRAQNVLRDYYEANPSARSAEEKLSQEGRRFYFTTAPDNYDGFGTMTVVAADRGLAPEPWNKLHGDKFRVISAAKEHADWQTQRNGSGGYVSIETTPDAVRAMLAKPSAPAAPPAPVVAPTPPAPAPAPEPPPPVVPTPTQGGLTSAQEDEIAARVAAMFGEPAPAAPPKAPSAPAAPAPDARRKQAAAALAERLAAASRAAKGD